MRIFNSIFNSFFRTIGRILAYLAVGAVIVYVISIAGCEKVKAADVEGCIDSGDSLQGVISIGKNKVGANYYYQWSSGDYDSSTFSGEFCTDFDIRTTNPTGTRFIGFAVDYCINGSNPSLQIWSYYDNFVDYTYSLGTNMFLTDADWGQAQCFRSFVRLKMNYEDNVGNSSLNFTNYTSRSPVFGMYADFGHNAIMRYTDIFYYNSYDYDNALAEAKKIGQSQNIINQNQTIINQNQQTNEKIDNVNDNLTNSNSEEATNEAGNFFSGFTTDTFGLTSIITAPLNLITSITSSSCSPVGVPIPFVDKTLNLPCLRGIYEEHFGSFFTVYQTITFGIVAYWVIVRIFALVKDFKNPDHDEIEVLDL